MTDKDSNANELSSQDSVEAKKTKKEIKKQEKVRNLLIDHKKDCSLMFA